MRAVYRFVRDCTRFRLSVHFRHVCVADVSPIPAYVGVCPLGMRRGLRALLSLLLPHGLNNTFIVEHVTAGPDTGLSDVPSRLHTLL